MVTSQLGLTPWRWNSTWAAAPLSPQRVAPETANATPSRCSGDAGGLAVSPIDETT